MAAMEAGKANSPYRCTAATASGGRCRLCSMRATRGLEGLAPVCNYHLRQVPAGLRAVVDERIRLRARLELGRRSNERHRRSAETRLARAEQRAQFRAWNADPWLPGSTLPVLRSKDAERIEHTLKHFGVVEGVVRRDTGETPSCQFMNTARWAALMFLAGRIDEAKVRRKIEQSVREDQRWLKRNRPERGI
jgi:hypothetical protein